jgi:hypothetical protein
MSRWHRRLAELRGDGLEPPTTFATTVQNAQNVQNSQPDPCFEHFERSEHDTVSSADPPATKATPMATECAAGAWGEAEAERAAIIQFEGAIPREWAEGFAQLEPDRPPGDVPLTRWQRFIDDGGLFLDSPFCAVAAVVGWGPLDLFGCGRDPPYARIDRAGLLWFLKGNKLIALSAQTATIETRTGQRHIWHRKLAEPGRVLAWELGIGSA